MSAPRKIALNLALYIAHEEPGDPGRGNRPDDDGDLVIVAPYAMRELVEETLEMGKWDCPRTRG